MPPLLSLCVCAVYAWLHYACTLVMRLVLIQPVRTRKARWCFATTLALAVLLFLFVLWDLAVQAGHGVNADVFFFCADAHRDGLSLRLRALPSSWVADTQAVTSAVPCLMAAHEFRARLFKLSLCALMVQVLLLNTLTVLEFFFTGSTSSRGAWKKNGGVAAPEFDSPQDGPRERRVRLRRSLFALIVVLTVLWWFFQAPPADVLPSGGQLRNGDDAPVSAASKATVRAKLSQWLRNRDDSGRRFLSVPQELAAKKKPLSNSARQTLSAAHDAGASAGTRVLPGRLGLMQNLQRSHNHGDDHNHDHGDGRVGHGKDQGGDTATRPDSVPSVTSQPTPSASTVEQRKRARGGDRDLVEADPSEGSVDSGATESGDDDVDDDEDDANASYEDEDVFLGGASGGRAAHEKTEGEEHARRIESTKTPVRASSGKTTTTAWQALLCGVSARLATAGVVLSGLLAGYASFTTPFTYLMPYMYWRGKEARLREMQLALSKRQRHVLQLYSSKQVRLGQVQYAALHEHQDSTAATAAPAASSSSSPEQGSGRVGVASSVKSVWSSLRWVGGRAASTVAAAVSWRRADVAQLAAESEGARFLSMTLFLQTDSVGHMLAEAHRGRTWVGPIYALLGLLFAFYTLVKAAMTAMNLMLYRYSTKDSVSTAVDWLRFLVGSKSDVVDHISGTLQTLILLVNTWMIAVSIRSLLLTLLQLTISISGGGVLSRADGFTVVLASCVGMYFVGQLVMLRQQLPEPAHVATPTTTSLYGRDTSSLSSLMERWPERETNVLLEVLGSLPVHYYQRLNDWSFFFGLLGTAFVRRFVLRDPATRGMNAVA